MKFFRLDLLTLLISLFILSSCKNQGNIGLGVNGSNQLEGSLIDTSTVVVNTLREDTAYTNALERTPLSYFKDPVLGTTEANLAIDLNLPGSAAYTLPNGTVTIDSAVLVLNYADGFFGDSISTRYKANVYQLDERMYAGAFYSNTKNWKRKSALLGSQSFFSKTHDSVSVIQPIKGLPDSLVRVPPQLRIPISPSFVNSILFNASPTQLSSNLVFKNAVNGLYITLDKGLSGPGGTFMFSLDSAAVKIYYQSNNGVSIDTGVVSMPSTLHAAEIKHTYTTAVQTELNNTKTSRNTFYLQGLLGLRAKISFPYVKNITKTIGSDAIVNRAELVITPVPGSAIPFEPLPRLMMYKYDLAHQRLVVEDNNSSDPRAFPASGGFYNADGAHKEYHFLVTGYVQDLMRGKSVDYGTFIGAAAPINSSFFNDVTPNPQIDGRTISVGSDLSSPYRIKLNIIYTKLPK